MVSVSADLVLPDWPLEHIREAGSRLTRWCLTPRRLRVRTATTRRVGYPDPQGT